MNTPNSHTVAVPLPHGWDVVEKRLVDRDDTDELKIREAIAECRREATPTTKPR